MQTEIQLQGSGFKVTLMPSETIQLFKMQSPRFRTSLTTVFMV